ncbi:MAG: Fic family protein [Bacteriovoracaceae bacterium]
MPKYQITSKCAKALMKIEALKETINNLPLTVSARTKLRETAKLVSTHYSTKIEGNRLTLDEAREVVKKEQHFPGRERDEQEVLGYYNALDEIESWANPNLEIIESHIQRLHALVMSRKRTKRKTPYRDGQNVIRDSQTNSIVYLPPEAKDVPDLMNDLVNWIEETKDDLPCPIRAGIAHYQFATIHPYYDGNGRTARLLTTLILYIGGYDLNGFYSLEEYYGKNLAPYYKFLDVGPSHNYYMGRVESDISDWVEYFCLGMADAFENVHKAAKEEGPKKVEVNEKLRKLDNRQRKALSLFQESETITANDISNLFGLKDRAARLICKKWVEADFIIVVDAAKRSRRYRINENYEELVRNE